VSTPARNSALSISGEALAGPTVATIFARRRRRMAISLGIRNCGTALRRACSNGSGYAAQSHPNCNETSFIPVSTCATAAPYRSPDPRQLRCGASSASVWRARARLAGVQRKGGFGRAIAVNALVIGQIFLCAQQPLQIRLFPVSEGAFG
jgi:hypothetical protein